ncbi:MAG: hypothetical protein LC781_08200 [Actinobacteria bacterium]|nr:hypothetical protein [Actinomycetota bacterium]
MTALHDHRLATMEGSRGNVLAEARQEGDHLPPGTAAWKLGQDLVDRREYERAAECFRGMLRSAETPVERLSIEAAEVAAQLCAALSRERAVEKRLRDACGMLGRDLSRLSHEEVSFARGALAACAEDRLLDTHDASFAAASGEATGTTAHGDSPSTEVTVQADVRPRLRIHFFDCFELLCDGEAMSLGRNARALAILKYLLAHRGGRPVSQDYLMGWLWPESDPKRARWSLNSTVYALRKLLGGCLSSLPASETVLFEGGGYRLSPRVLLSVDTDEFDSRYEEGLQLEEAGRVAEAVVEYEKAADLYRGDYLIEDLYEEWTVIERERLCEVYVDLSRRLAVHYMEGGRLREGVRTCYRVLEKDRSDEDAHRLLMECFVRLGQRSRALRQYGLCEQALRGDYDMPPSPGTRALYASIMKDSGFR